MSTCHGHATRFANALTGTGVTTDDFGGTALTGFIPLTIGKGTLTLNVAGDKLVSTPKR